MTGIAYTRYNLSRVGGHNFIALPIGGFDDHPPIASSGQDALLKRHFRTLGQRAILSPELRTGRDEAPGR
jgi:hypothetical protein